MRFCYSNMSYPSRVHFAFSKYKNNIVRYHVVCFTYLFFKRSIEFIKSLRDKMSPLCVWAFETVPLCNKGVKTYLQPTLFLMISNPFYRMVVWRDRKLHRTFYSGWLDKHNQCTNSDRRSFDTKMSKTEKSWTRFRRTGKAKKRNNY